MVGSGAILSESAMCGKLEGKMLEELALHLAAQTEVTQVRIGLLLFLTGAIAAAIVRKSEARLARAPYFAGMYLIAFCVAIVNFISWIWIIPAITGGYLWITTLMWFAALFASGFFYCRITLARSRDAYGHAWMALLGFIPLVGFWLMFKRPRPKDEMSTDHVLAIPLLSGGRGVLVGFSLWIATAFAWLVVNNLAQEPGQQLNLVSSMVHSHGPERTLHIMAGWMSSKERSRIDEVTTLAKVEVIGTQLQLTYIVDDEGVGPPTREFHAIAQNMICSNFSFMPIMRRGGSVAQIYLDRHGRQFDAILVTPRDCGF